MEVTLILVIAIFAINVGLARPVLDSFLFSLALAVGLTPQLLPAIVSVTWPMGPAGWPSGRSSSSAWPRSRTSAAWTSYVRTKPAR